MNSFAMKYSNSVYVSSAVLKPYEYDIMNV